jgi:hypothetical protein
MSDPAEQPARPVERRRSPRYACVLEAAWVKGGTTAFQPVWPARVLDISRHGLGMHVAECFPEGTVLTLTLHHMGQKEALGQYQVRVVRTTRQPNGTWCLGADFSQPLTEQELRMLLS